MKHLRPSQIILIIGLAVLLVGCILSYMRIEPWADYVLVAGALLVIARGAISAREHREEN